MAEDRKDSAKSGDAGRSAIATPANVVTIVRMCLVPVFVAVLLAPWPDWLGLVEISTQTRRYMAAIVFIVISCTDWLDGYLARKRNEVTDFGKFMDPLADKILVAAALVSLVELGSLPTWVVLVILVREFVVSGLRMLAASKGLVIAASYLGKIKTVLQMIAIVMFVLKDSHINSDFESTFSDMFWVVSWVVMIAALLFTIASLFDYIAKTRKALAEIEAQKAEAAAAEEGEPGECGEYAAQIHALAAQVVERALEGGRTVATAESLTGGLIAGAITQIPGSSAVLKGGVVSYTNEVKHQVLGVAEDVLETVGPVSQETAIAMADGARGCIGSDIAVSVTGIAGPGGAEPGKPVGTVWMGLSRESGCEAVELHFEGNREAVRSQTVIAALTSVYEALGE